LTPAQQIIRDLPLETLFSERAKNIENRLPTADFDAAIAARGATIPDAARAKAFEQHGVAEQSTAKDYDKAHYGALTDQLPPERMAEVKAVTTEWAAKLNFSKAQGETIIQLLATWGPRTAAMSEAERAQWIADNDRISTRVAGGPEGLKTMIEKATALLKDRAGDSDLTKAMLQNAPWVLRQAVLLRMLFNHSVSLDALTKKYGGK
jgi:hypothetical protein